jgi:hypothetical protein
MCEAILSRSGHAKRSAQYISIAVVYKDVNEYSDQSSRG